MYKQDELLLGWSRGHSIRTLLEKKFYMPGLVLVMYLNKIRSLTSNVLKIHGKTNTFMINYNSIMWHMLN